MSLTVSVDQQNTWVRRSGPVQNPGDTEGDIGGGCRFADTPFMVGEYKNAGHCLFLMTLMNLNDFAVLAKTPRKCVTLFSEVLLARAASLQGD
jgi:hypothetical protein